MNYPQYIDEWILDLIFPARCLECGAFLTQNKGYICKKCLKSIPLKKSFECIGCKKSTPLGRTCISCKNDASVDQLLIVSDYSCRSIVELIKALKYRFIKEVALPFSIITKRYIAWLGTKKKFNILLENPLIIPVPLHPRRLNWRGFNQAELIAEAVANILNLNPSPDILRRKTDRKAQVKIEGRAERLENIKNIFQINPEASVNGRVILLIDDVCTTGATLNECAKTLKDGGAKKVIGLVIARG